MTRDVRVLIADDHAPVRAGVRRALERGGLAVCAECATADEAISRAEAERPDVCLLDLNMPGDGLTAAREISSRLPQTTILMLTVSDDERDLLAALESGAAGYLLKGIDPLRLPFAVLGAVAGDAVIPREMAARSIRPFRDGDPERRALVESTPEELSSREWDVLDLLRLGHSTGEIAAELQISAITVRRHVSEIVRKLGVEDRESAVRLIASGGRSRPAVQE